MKRPGVVDVDAGAGKSDQHGNRIADSVARPADIAMYRRRRALRRSCRRAEQHLRAAGLWGVLSARVLDDLEADAS
ncbi:hypothetical protein [Saccharomonospora sp. CUA-673]|uniref:hypothetical protein n=1 Tax=Saccharomonospora sp. CUA-673 TaxID=1904969 RepID=UPI001301340B|nr:hypothetical protein [Saccharomonospora sp. CUA-673]